MRRVLVLGGSGALGHKVYQVLAPTFDTYATVRRFDEKLRETGLFDPRRVIEGVDAFEFGSVRKAIDQLKPDVIVNCVGIIKQLEEARNAKTAIYINSLFPHLVAEHAWAAGAKLVHISTDCVFSGRRGDYVETDTPDPEDLYGKTKHLGEVDYGGHLTLRTSFVGRELFSRVSLIEWFLSQQGKTVRGYVNAIYTGLTSLALAREIGRCILEFPQLTGLYHLSSEKISKYRLLNLVKAAYGVNIDIEPYSEFRCDRSLDSGRYRRETGFVPPSWEDMVSEMARDRTPYEKWRAI